MQIKIKGHHFLLLCERAVFWEEKQTLLIGDLHLGKITHFRKEGIAVPAQAIGNNFQRLNHILQSTGAERIIFLGDLFHSEYNSEWELFREWRMSHKLIEMVLVTGNHDILPVSLLREAGLSVSEQDFEEDHFIFTHHPKEDIDAAKFVFAGHIHPVFTMYGMARQSIRLPCFVIDPHQAILPSFGVFTGGFSMEMIRERKIYMTTESRVFEVSA